MSEIPRVYVSANRYIQGRGAIKEIGIYVKSLGKKAIIVENWEGARDLIVKSLEENGVRVIHVEHDLKECTHGTVDRLARIVGNEKANVVIGVGGGKVVDTAKAVAAKTGTATVTVPTQCATNADASGLSVMYTEKHQFVEYLLHPKNPDLVVADSEILARAPYQFITSGMGDALACMFEADACVTQPNARNIRGGRPTAAAVSVTHLCFENLMTYGIQAAKDTKNGLLTAAVEKVIESVKLLSCLGFEGSGLAAAHALHNGITTIPGLNASHGQLVAFCTISQLILEGRPPDFIGGIVKWVSALGLPVTLKELGVSISSMGVLMNACDKACDSHDTMKNMPLNIRPEMVKDAVLAADAIGAEQNQKDY